MNFKLLYITILMGLIFSCETQKNVVSETTTKLVLEKHNQIPKLKIIKENNIDFYNQNTALKPGDNTISYGSIVSANPSNYKIDKSFFPSQGQNFRIKYVILHYTALDNPKSLKVLTQQSVSSHYLVNDSIDANIYQLVDENKRAYHAGISSWKKDINLNDTSIGIEIVNKGYIVENSKKVFFNFPEKQMQKVAQLVLDIAKRYEIPPTRILAHSDIAPTRKQDPGALFPWQMLYKQYNIGMWYEMNDKIRFQTEINTPSFESDVLFKPEFIKNFQNELFKLGYGITPTGVLDDATKKTIEAFQYHFRPEKYDGLMDLETYAILKALNYKYPN